MSKSTLQRIRSLELFAGCSHAQLAKIDEMGCWLRVGHGRVLCAEGAVGAEFFVLLEGLAEVHSSRGASALLRSGAWFGELALLDRGYRRATVTAITDATVLVFDRREFTTLLSIAPEVRKRLLHASQRLLAGRSPTTQTWYEPTRACVSSTCRVGTESQ